MCHFVVVAIPDTCAERLREAVHSSREQTPTSDCLYLEEFGNESLRDALPRRFSCYTVTSSGCSCGLWSDGKPHPPVVDIDARRRKYRRKGWSEAKIERAIEEALGSSPEAENFIGLKPDLANMLASLARRAGRIAVLVHWGHDFETAKLAKGQTAAVTAEELQEGNSFDEEVLVWVHGSPDPSRTS